MKTSAGVILLRNFDKETGTIYLRARYYDPVVGRFITEDDPQYSKDKDPLSLNLYTYCNNDPLNNWDPNGHESGDYYYNTYYSEYNQKTYKLYQYESKTLVQINKVDTKFNNELNNFKNIYAQNIKVYEKISARTGLPPELIAAIHYRESGCDFKTYLHNGDPLGKPTTHVPKGKNFNNFEDAAVDAFLDKKYIKDKYHLSTDCNDITAMLTYAESYNGLGYYSKGRVSPYVYSGTNVYKGGKYSADGVYNPNLRDAQPGAYILIMAIKK